MNNLHTITDINGRPRPSGILERLIATFKRGMSSDIVSYPATRGVGMVVLPSRSSRRSAVADIVGGVSDRETLAAA